MHNGIAFYLITGEALLALALLFGKSTFKEFDEYSFFLAMTSLVVASALFICTWPLWFLLFAMGKFRAR